MPGCRSETLPGKVRRASGEARLTYVPLRAAPCLIASLLAAGQCGKNGWKDMPQHLHRVISSSAHCSTHHRAGMQVVDFKRRSYAEVSRTFGPTIRRRFEQQQLKEHWWVD